MSQWADRDQSQSRVEAKVGHCISGITGRGVRVFLFHLLEVHNNVLFCTAGCFSCVVVALAASMVNLQCGWPIAHRSGEKCEGSQLDESPGSLIIPLDSARERTILCLPFH